MKDQQPLSATFATSIVMTSTAWIFRV